LLFASIAALPLLARGSAIAAQRRNAFGANSEAIRRSFTTFSPVAGH
jgi:hypothetical protein